MQGQTNRKIKEKNLQRTLRNNMTDAEQALWQILRGRQMKGYKFRRQHPFDDFILDFVCLENLLVIEVDGGQHAEQADADEDRSEKLRKAGFQVLRFWNNEVLQELNAVKERIWLVLQQIEYEEDRELAIIVKERQNEPTFPVSLDEL